MSYVLLVLRNGWVRIYVEKRELKIELNKIKNKNKNE